MFYTSAFRYLIDRTREISIPVGILVFSETNRYVKIRWVDDLCEVPKELKGISNVNASLGVCYGHICEDIRQMRLPLWKEKGKGPEPTPYEKKYWEHYTALLMHNVVLGEIRPYVGVLDGHPDQILNTEFDRLVAAYGDK